MTDPKQSLKQHFLSAPAAMLDPALLPIVVRWDDPPTSIQLLELLDHCVHTGGAPRFVIMAIESVMLTTMKAEGVTSEDLLPRAVWRNT